MYCAAHFLKDRKVSTPASLLSYQPGKKAESNVTVVYSYKKKQYANILIQMSQLYRFN